MRSWQAAVAAQQLLARKACTCLDAVVLCWLSQVLHTMHDSTGLCTNVMEGMMHNVLHRFWQLVAVCNGAVKGTRCALPYARHTSALYAPVHMQIGRLLIEYYLFAA